MKYDTCLYCGYRYKLPSFVPREEEKSKCFSCQVNEGFIESLALGVKFADRANKSSKTYWSEKLLSLVKYADLDD